MTAEEFFTHEPRHPLLPLPDLGVVRTLQGRPDGGAVLAELLQQRRDIIARSREEPVSHELEPAHWGDVRKMIAEKVRTVILLGGNRSGKSRLCGRLVMEALLNHPGTQVLCVSENEQASRETQQQIIWHYTPRSIKALNGRRDRERVFYVNYSEYSGFGDERKLALPRPKGYWGRPSMLMFATYEQSPDVYEGTEWGHPDKWGVNWWADENLRLAWLNMLLRRGGYRPGSGLWSYTPIKGITPTIKQSLGDAPETIEHKPAKLLAERVNVPGLPAGTMPYIQRPFLKNARVIYFHTELSPFGPGIDGTGRPTYFERVAADLADKSSEQIKRLAYGYTEDVIGKAFPLFCGVHVVRPELIPSQGTNYQFNDPGGSKSWFSVWVRVTPTNPSTIYIYRDWPDEATYGEWALPTERAISQDSRKGWDGEPGPAQSGQGWGVAQYKAMWFDQEGAKWDKEANDWVGGEVVVERTIDSRAGKSQHAAEQGGTCLVDDFASEQRDADGRVFPAMSLTLASGVTEDEGLEKVNDLLYFDASQPFDAVRNSPRLFVSANCRQVIWALGNFTGRSGPTGACKDPIDLLRYVALADLEYRDPSRPVKRPGGSY
jgi:hypothetical protein